MDIIVIGGNNHRAEMRELMAALAASGIDSICADTEKAKALEFKCREPELPELKPQLQSWPEIKRGKGKVKRW